jgi:hypothetical protein
MINKERGQYTNFINCTMRLTLSFKYIIATTIIILVIMGITMSVISMNHEKLLVRQTEMQAKALFQQIVVTRRWVAEHGGIFIEELPWLSDNAFIWEGVVIMTTPSQQNGSYRPGKPLFDRRSPYGLRGANVES